MLLKRKRKFLAWSPDPSQRMIIAFSSMSMFQAQLPAGNGLTFSLQLLMYIRDTRDCLTEQNLTMITIRPDSNTTIDLLKMLDGSTSGYANNSLLARLLATGNQNNIGQIISMVSYQLNQFDTEYLADAISSSCLTNDLLFHA
jgi:hypothetical protein